MKYVWLLLLVCGSPFVAWAEECPPSAQAFLEPGEVCYEVTGFVASIVDTPTLHGPEGEPAGGYYFIMDRPITDGLCDQQVTWHAKGAGVLPWRNDGAEFDASSIAVISSEALGGHPRYPIRLRFRGLPAEACDSQGRHVVRYAQTYPPPCWKDEEGLIEDVQLDGSVIQWNCVNGRDLADLITWRTFYNELVAQPN